MKLMFKSLFQPAELSRKMSSKGFADRHGDLSGPALEAVAASYQLPLDLNMVGEDQEDHSDATSADKLKSGRPRSGCAAIVLALSLKKALS